MKIMAFDTDILNFLTYGGGIEKPGNWKNMLLEIISQLVMRNCWLDQIILSKSSII